jgi:hypothetical protein
VSNQQQYPQSLGTARVVDPTPSAWKSIPEAVRFAVWVWAISVILGIVGAILFGVVFVIGMAAS